MCSFGVSVFAMFIPENNCFQNLGSEKTARERDPLQNLPRQEEGGAARGREATGEAPGYYLAISNK